jgi:DNA polymerase
MAVPKPIEEFPERGPPSLKSMADWAARCRACDLWRDATQTVAGEGPRSAALMLVGEQPGDKEDLAGKPFVGPAGHLLDRALAAARVERDAAYVTNAVKHFKFRRHGKRRLHQRPDVQEIETSRWWLDQEVRLVKPKGILAMGATAARSLLRKPTTISRVRGTALPYEYASFPCLVLVTVHPSALLRIPDEAARHAAFADFVRDIETLWRTLNSNHQSS